MMNPLFDKEFLYELDQIHHKEVYAKVIALTFEENPIEQIEGRVTGGSINIDGTSSVQRSCSLSLVAQELNINDFYWGLTNKIQIQIGIKNNIDKRYPDIIWFNQGIFVITAFNTSIGTNNYSVSVSGKDKMCLLNGDVGGSLPASIDFGQLGTYESNYIPVQFDSKTEYTAHTYYIQNSKGDYVLSDEEFRTEYQYYEKEVSETLTRLPLKTIIRESVHTYGNEPYHNIIVNDLEETGLELLEYRGDIPLYLLYDEAEEVYKNMTMKDNVYGYVINKDSDTETKVMDIYCSMDESSPDTIREANAAIIATDGVIKKSFGEMTASVHLDRFGIDDIEKGYDKFLMIDGEDDTHKSVIYSLVKLETGAVAGYRETELTYPGDLISNVGEALTSILDKIIQMLGDFEYFYDVDGHFVFQRQKTYINTSWNTITEITDRLTIDDIYVDNAAGLSSSVYSFEDSNLITSIQNNPDINNVRNDFSVWSTRENNAGITNTIHARLAIDKKPWYYKSYDNIVYTTNPNWQKEVRESIKKTITEELQTKLYDYKMQYPVMPGFKAPTHELDNNGQWTGAWKGGWWDIRDWREYYYIITQTEPTWTMKWYSQNNLEGCVSALDLRQAGAPIPENVADDRYGWMLVQNDDGEFVFTHGGSGSPINSEPKPCTCKESYYDASGTLRAREVKDPITNQTIIKSFIQPYYGCSDDHTYLYFMDTYVKQGQAVYFYNPKFPTVSESQSVIDVKVEEEVSNYFFDLDIHVVDWREIIYQMAVDYYQHNQEDDFLTDIAEHNRNVQFINAAGDIEIQSYYIDGFTGYEQYYSDMQGFWRQLYDPTIAPEIIQSGGYYNTGRKYVDSTIGTYTIEPVWNPYSEIINDVCDYFLPTPQTLANNMTSLIKGHEITVADFTIPRYQIDQLLFACDTLTNYFDVNQTNFNTNLKNLKTAFDNENYQNILNCLEELNEDFKKLPLTTDVTYKSHYNDTYAWWHKNVINEPYLLNFWLEFLDDAGELSKYAVPVIGNRPKVINDNNVTSIYFRETPNVIYESNPDKMGKEYRKTGYTYVYLTPSMANLFIISAQGKSAKDRIDELLYNHTYCTENITINTLPIYYLVPNVRIFIHDDLNQINGEYIVSRLSMPLSFNGTMSISATKAVDRLY